MVQGLHTMYRWVRETREVLFRYCEGLPPDLYTRELPDVGWGSIRTLHVHVADCYLGWLREFAMEQPGPGLDPSAHPNVDAVRATFAEMDRLVDAFLDCFADTLDVGLTRPVPRRPEGLTVTPRWLFTHTITHEFHHKGQIVAIGRRLGHVAPDTDLVIP